MEKLPISSFQLTLEFREKRSHINTIQRFVKIYRRRKKTPQYQSTWTFHKNIQFERQLFQLKWKINLIPIEWDDDFGCALVRFDNKC